MHDASRTTHNARRTTHNAQRTTRNALLRIVPLVLLLVAASVVAYHQGWFDFERVTTLLSRLRGGRSNWPAAGVFAAIAATAIAIGLPALPFTVAAGALFGVVLGSFLAWAGALSGSMLGYVIARKVGRDSARRWIARKAGAAALTESTTFLALLRIRLVPLVPLSVVNFAAGLSHTHFTRFVAATAVGILPVTLVFVYFADNLVEGLHGAKSQAYRSVAIASGSLIVLSLVPLLIRWRARRAAPRPTGSA
jgi:uncharacterized membrane protein YdjX (TVP38/TMEM64 family)